MRRSKIPNATIVEALRLHAKGSPDRPAFRFLSATSASVELTFGELDKNASKLARLLRSRVRRGDRVLMFYPAGLEFINAFFGVLYAGAIAVPLVPPRRRGAAQHVKALIENAEPAAVLTSSHLELRIRESLIELGSPFDPIVTDRAIVDVPFDASGGHETMMPLPESLCVLQYTSGSTATPRGVMVTHENVARNSFLVARQTELDHNSVWVSWVPHFHDLGLFGSICTPLYSGILSVLMPPAEFVARPISWLEAIARHGGTISAGPNFAYDLCARQIQDQDCVGLDLSRWTVAACAAEPIRIETLNAFVQRFARYGLRRESVCPFYGLAEATLLVSGGPVGAGQTAVNVSLAATRRHRLAVPEDRTDSYAVPSCGPPSPEHRILIVDPETGGCCAPDVIGEIWIEGSTTGPGYWRNPEESARVFGARLATGEGPFMRTGDLGFIRNGILYVTGRIKDLMIIRGQNVYPQDLEAAARAAVPEAGAAAAFALNDAPSERAVLVIEAPKQAPSDLSSTLEAVRIAVLAGNGIDLDRVVLTRRRALPKTSSGKIQHARARAMLLEGSLPVLADWRAEEGPTREIPDHVGAVSMMLALKRQSEAEQIGSIRRYLESLLRELVGVESDDFDQNETLIAMGVTSLGLLQLRTRVEAEFMIHLDPEMFWQDIAFAHLARELRCCMLASPLWANAEAVESLVAEIANMSDEDVSREISAHIPLSPETSRKSAATSLSETDFLTSLKT